MDGKGAMVGIVAKFHLGSVKTGFTFNKITDGGVFFDGFRPEWITRKAEEIGSFICHYFNNDIGPAS